MQINFIHSSSVISVNFDDYPVSEHPNSVALKGNVQNNQSINEDCNDAKFCMPCLIIHGTIKSNNSATTKKGYINVEVSIIIEIKYTSTPSTIHNNNRMNE